MPTFPRCRISGRSLLHASFTHEGIVQETGCDTIESCKGSCTTDSPSVLAHTNQLDTHRNPTHNYRYEHLDLLCTRLKSITLCRLSDFADKATVHGSVQRRDVNDLQAIQMMGTRGQACKHFRGLPSSRLTFMFL